MRRNLIRFKLTKGNESKSFVLVFLSDCAQVNNISIIYCQCTVYNETEQQSNCANRLSLIEICTYKRRVRNDVKSSIFDKQE